MSMAPVRCDFCESGQNKILTGGSCICGPNVRCSLPDDRCQWGVANKPDGEWARTSRESYMNRDGEVEDITHAGCQAAYERAQRRAEFAEARLSMLTAEFYRLSFRFDRVDGHTTTHDVLGDRTLGGAIRAVLTKGVDPTKTGSI